MNRKIKRYGWIPDLPDHRDHLYAAPLCGCNRFRRKSI